MTEKELATLTARLDVFAAQANEVANSPASAAGPAAVVIGKNWLQDLSKQLSKAATGLREGLMSDAPVEMPERDYTLRDRRRLERMGEMPKEDEA